MIGAVSFNLFNVARNRRRMFVSQAGGTALEVKRHSMTFFHVAHSSSTTAKYKILFLTFSLISFELSCSFRSMLKLNGRMNGSSRLLITIPLEIAVNEKSAATRFQ